MKKRRTLIDQETGEEFVAVYAPQPLPEQVSVYHGLWTLRTVEEQARVDENVKRIEESRRVRR